MFPKAQDHILKLIVFVVHSSKLFISVSEEERIQKIITFKKLDLNHFYIYIPKLVSDEFKNSNNLIH